MKKLFLAFLIAASMTGITHAQSCPTGYNYDANDGCQPISTGAETCAYGYEYDANAGCVPTETSAGTPVSGSGSSKTSGNSGFIALAPIPGLTADATANEAGLANFLNNLYRYAVGLAATIAVIQIIWAGLSIAINKDDVSNITDKKGKIYNALFGLVLVLSPVVVFSIINPSILNLSINLQPLDTKSGAPIQTETTPYTPSATEVLDRPAGTNILFSFEVDPNISPNAVIQTLNAKLSACTNATGGPGIIVPASLQTTLRRFVCQTCASGRTATPLLSCTRQNTTFVCGNCN